MWVSPNKYKRAKDLTTRNGMTDPICKQEHKNAMQYNKNSCIKKKVEGWNYNKNCRYKRDVELKKYGTSSGTRIKNFT